VPRDVFGDRSHRFAAPQWVVFQALNVEQDKWLRLNPGEVRPVVLESVKDERVVWSSFWPVSPSDTIEFELSRYGGGTELNFRWFSDTRPTSGGSTSHGSA
jgi:hypothetical protein